MDDRIREIVRAARAEVEAAADVDDAWRAFSAMRSPVAARPAAALASSTRRAVRRGARRWPWFAVAAGTAIALVIVAVVAVLSEGQRVRTVDTPATPSGPAPSAVADTAGPATSDTSATTPASSPPTPPDASAPATSEMGASGPGSTSVVTRTWEALGNAAGAAWEGAGIPRGCGDVWDVLQQVAVQRCTELAVDPYGVPVTFDPAARTVTRHTRRDGVVSFSLPSDLVDVSLLAVGPADVAYFALTNDWPLPADVVAVSVAPADAGTVLERFEQVLGVGDADVFSTSTGLVLSGWYDDGPRPAPDAGPFVPWVRSAGIEEAGQLASTVWFDDAGGTVTANNWTWSLGERLVPGLASTSATDGTPGNGRVVATFDGGFLAVYTEHSGDLRAEVVRGYRDGTVEHWLLPGSWMALGTPILEPQGTIVLPDGDRFVRVAPFVPRPTGWDGPLVVDPATGTAEAPGLDEVVAEYQAGLPPSSDDTLPWGLGPTAFADALAGPTSSPAELRTVVPAADGLGATVMTEGFLDDSVLGAQLLVRFEFDQWLRVDRIDWSQSCQPGRGHQDFQITPCL